MMENLVEMTKKDLRKIDGGVVSVFWVLYAWAGGEQMKPVDRCNCDRAWNQGVSR